MKHTELMVPVTILEAEDLEGITDEGRVNGDMEAARQRIQSKFDRLMTVSVGIQPGPKGDLPWIAVGSGSNKVRLFAGEAVAFFPNGPTKIDVPEEPEPAPKPEPAKKSAAKKAVASRKQEEDE